MQLPLGEDSIQYEIEGKGPETLVFIPALGLTGDMWKQQVEHFRTSHTVVTYDAGHMQSGPVRQDATLEEFAEELARLLDAVGVISGHIVGISMGGMIAQVFAINYPDRVKSLVLACTTPSYPEESRQQMRTRADTAEHVRIGVEHRFHMRRPQRGNVVERDERRVARRQARGVAKQGAPEATNSPALVMPRDTRDRGRRAGS